MPAKKEKIHAHEHQSQASGKLVMDAQDSEYEMDAEAAAFHVIHGDQLQLPGTATGNSGFPFMQDTTAVQRSAKGEGGAVSAETEQSIAESRGKGNPLPGGTKQEMEASLGGNFDGVNIHTNEKAAGLSADLQAEAFTVGQDIYFGKNAFNPANDESKHVLAHELRHTQQQANNSGGEKIQRYVKYYRSDQTRIVPPGENADAKKIDKYDKYHARKEEKPEKNKLLLQGWRHPNRRPLLISNDGKMAVEDIGYTRSRLAWADVDLIKKANEILTSQKSYLELKEEPNDLLVGNVPKDGLENPSKDKFKKIKPVHNGKDLTDPEVTGKMMFNSDKESTGIDDCGRACGLIIGSTTITSEGDPAKKGNEALPQATIRERFLVSGGQMQGVITQAFNNPDVDMKVFIQKVLLNEDAYKNDPDVISSPEKAYKKYMVFPGAEKDVLDKKYGMNKYAKPSWGKGITIANPYHAARKKENQQATRMGNSTPHPDIGVNFHYASNIMESDSDYMAFEAYVGHENWYFWMYGEDKGQSFYEAHKEAVHDSTAVNVSPTNP